MTSNFASIQKAIKFHHHIFANTNTSYHETTLSTSREHTKRSNGTCLQYSPTNFRTERTVRRSLPRFTNTERAPSRIATNPISQLQRPMRNSHSSQMTKSQISSLSFSIRLQILERWTRSTRYAYGSEFRARPQFQARVLHKPNTATLANIFKMNHNQHADISSEVINIVMKELNIEKGINELTELWNKMRFTVHVYKRTPTATEERGIILTGIDKIFSQLDDKTMMLQTLSSKNRLMIGKSSFHISVTSSRYSSRCSPSGCTSNPYSSA